MLTVNHKSLIVKSLVSCFLFLVACFLFVFAVPNVTKPAHAAITCANLTSTVAPGGTIRVTTNLNGSPAPGTNIMVINPGGIHLTPDPFTVVDGGTTTFTVPGSVANGTYSVVWALVANCSGSLQVTTIPGGGTPSCTNNTANVAPGGTIQVRIFLNGASAPGTNIMVINPGSIHLTPDPFTPTDGTTITFTVPGSVANGSYTVVWAFVATCSGSLNVTTIPGGGTPSCTNNTSNTNPGGTISIGAFLNGASMPATNIMVLNPGSIHLTPDPFTPGGTTTFTVPNSVTSGTYDVVWAFVATCANQVSIGTSGGGTSGGGTGSGGGANCASFTTCIAGITSPTTNYAGKGLIGSLLTSILPLIIGIGGFLTVVMIVISGIQMVTSSGNPEAAAAARNRLTFALVGFILLVLAFAFTQIIDVYFLRGSGVINLNS